MLGLALKFVESFIDFLAHNSLSRCPQVITQFSQENNTYVIMPIVNCGGYNLFSATKPLILQAILCWAMFTQLAKISLERAEHFTLRLLPHRMLDIGLAQIIAK